MCQIQLLLSKVFREGISPFYRKEGKKKVEKHKTELRELDYSIGSTSYLLRSLKQECGIKSGIFRGATGVENIKNEYSYFCLKNKRLTIVIFNIGINRIKNTLKPWLVWLSGLSTGLQSKRSLVLFPIRAHAWVAGKVCSWVFTWGHVRSSQSMFVSHVDVCLTHWFLSLPIFLPSPLSKNK